MKKKISIENVAKLAGVSISTVSRVINKSLSVGKANRIKVEKAIKELGFKPDFLAQHLASGRSIPAVGLVIPRYEGAFYSFYALQLIRGIGIACDNNKLDLFLHITGSLNLGNMSSLSGVIFADIIGNRKHLEAIFAMNIPCVVINNIIEDLDVDCIAVDNQAAAKEAVEYLINLGHKKIAHVTGDLNTQAARMRLEGYKDALNKNNLSINSEYIVETDYSRQEARGAAEKLLNMEDRPTALFVASDSMALEIMGVISKEGLEVPKDISIVGFDDNPEGLYAPVSLTTVKQPLIEIGQMAVDRLKVLVEKRPDKKEKISLPCEIVVRDSCRHM